MKNKKNIVIALALFVVLSIVAVVLLKKPKVVESNKKESVTETKSDKTNKTDKTVKEDKNDKKPDEKKSDTKADEKKSDVKAEETSTSTETNTPTENTTSVTSKNDTPKNTETTTSNSTNSVPAPCVPTYTTVNHPEQGHYETRVVKEAEYVPVYDRKIVGGQTGRVYNSLDEWGAQDEDYSYSVKTVQVGTEYHEAITEQVWVVDQPAYTTTESSGC